MSKKEEVKNLIDSVEQLEKINLPHRNLQKQLDHMIESIYEEIMIELSGTDLLNSIRGLEDPFSFIKKWAETEN